MKNHIGNYIQHVIYLTPSQIKSFGKSYTISQDYSNLKNKKRFIVFFTKTQIKKLEKAKVNNEKVDLKFSKAQFKKTLNHVMRLNNNVTIEENRKKLKNIKEEKRKKLQLLLKNIKEESKKKLDKINKIKLHILIKNKIEENERNKPKPKKKKITDLIKFPEINLI